jgi:hypothetical protein
MTDDAQPPGTVPAAVPGALTVKGVLTDKELDRIRAAWERKRHGPPKLLTPLPRRVRLRLAAEHAINRAAIWLVDHGRYGAAERLWRTFGLWRS